MHTLSRRNFLALSGAGLASMTLPSAVSAIGGGHPINNIGIQLYTVRDLMQKNVASTLESLAKIGYKEIEFAGYFDKSAKEIKGMLAANGLKSFSTHVRLENLQGDVLSKTLDYAAEVGHEYVVLPWLNKKQRQTIDQYKGYADLLNKAGVEAKKRGMKMGYHNHAFEFDTVDGQIPYYVLLEETDPVLVKMTMDLYWVQKAGVDHMDLINKYAGRFEQCHVKDMAKDGSITDVGTGIIDFAKILKAGKKAGFKHFYIENDRPVNSLETAKTCFKNLSALKV